MKISRLSVVTTLAALLPLSVSVAQNTPASPSNPTTTPSQNTQTPPTPENRQGMPRPQTPPTPENPRNSQSPQNTPSQNPQPPSASPGNTGTFRSMDSDGDGRLSRSEAASDGPLGGAFNKADKNGDGFLDESEFDRRATTTSPDDSKTPAPQRQ